MQKNHMYFWLLVLCALMGFVWVLGGVLMPFICGIAIAYLLGPVLQQLARLRVGRKYAVLLILGTFFATLGVILALGIPFVYRQSVQLAADLPHYAEQFHDRIGPYILWVQEKFHTGDLTQYQDAIKNNLDRVFKVGGTLAAGIIGGSQFLFGLFSFVIITPLVAYFVMSKWFDITRWIDDMIPRRNYDTIRSLLSQMDIKISGFVRGQILVSFFLGLIYAVSLSIAGLNFSVLIGLTAGILSIIPMFGSTVGLVVAVLVAWFQSESIQYTGIIAAIFLTGQFLEGNVISPKIIGDSVGLHPLWILFSLMAGGALFGITGMFLAVPVTAVIGVMLSFAIQKYKASIYYDDAPSPAVEQNP